LCAMSERDQGARGRWLILQYTGGGRVFLDDYLSDLPHGGVFVETEDDFEVGEGLWLRFVFPGVPEGIDLGGTIAWRRLPTKWRSALQPGIGVAFDPDQDGPLGFILEHCRGQVDSLRRKGRRIPVDFPVDIAFEGGWISGMARDISRGGVFVETGSPFELDELVDIRLRPERFDEPETLGARVAWRRSGGSSAGVGFEFRFTTPLRRRRLESLVREMEEILVSEGGSPRIVLIVR